MIIIFFLMNIYIVNAGSIGISPAKHSLFFEPNKALEFNFKVINSNPDGKLEIYVKGDLSKYVKIDKDMVIGFGIVNVKINLPDVIDKPGVHRILIGAREVSSNNLLVTGVGGLAAIQAPIDIIVPYPGKYAEARFITYDANKGENVSYEVSVNNLGTDAIFFDPYLEVYNQGKNITDFKFERIILNPKESYNKKGNLSYDFSPGYYNSSFFIDYGEKIRLDSFFRIGELFVNITDYSYEFVPGEINNFYIEIENLWNNPINKAYGEIVITDNGVIVAGFKLSFVNLLPWQKANISSFFDAKNIKEGRYIANMNIYYEDKITNKLVTVYFKEPSFYNLKNIGIIIGAVFAALFFIITIYMFFKIRRLERDSKIKKTRCHYTLKGVVCGGHLFFGCSGTTAP
ncbi:MAG: hypothetical protein Q8N99_01200 [Nanoarchaeota archaeon]|nr:hypothetical protein [Nanoarchaeota archaeon]